MYSYAGNDPVNFVDPNGLATLTTDMDEETTTFDPRPEEPDGSNITIETRNNVDSKSLPGASDGYTTEDVNWIESGTESPAYGPDGAYIDTGDKRGRDIHGGGSKLKNPFAPNQGWSPTRGCTRGQNSDIQKMGNALKDFKKRNPGAKIKYIRK